MRKLIQMIPIAAAAFSLFAIPVQAQVFNIYPNQPFGAGTQSSASLLSIETPFRCQTDSLKNQQVITSIRVEPEDFKLKYVDTIDDLPRYEVNGFSFDEKPLDEALQQLVEEAGIEVYTEDEAYISLNAKDIYGELALVVDELTKAGETYYKYDAKQKRLYLTRRGQFELKVPVNRVLILGVLDALRGAGVENANPNWKTGVITLTLTHEEERRLEKLMAQMIEKGQFLVADTTIYSIASMNTNGNWGEIIQSFGADKIHTSNNGLMGKLLSMDHQKSSENLMQSIQKYYQVQPVSQGMAVVPSGWKMRFDIGRCATASYAQNQLSLLIFPHLKKNGTVDARITLDSANGELSTFRVNAAVDNELAIIGIPDQTGFGSELLAIMKLKLIRLVNNK